MPFSPKIRIIVDWARVLIGLVIFSFGVYLTIGTVKILPWAVVTLIGWMIGCNVGIGTVIFVFGTGALMPLFSMRSDLSRES